MLWWLEKWLCGKETKTKHGLTGQICFSSMQTLAIYDRFGRLMYGQEDVPRDVLEYIVFEKHLTNPYGSWRMHAKIVPPWAPPKQPILKVRPLPHLRGRRQYSYTS